MNKGQGTAQRINILRNNRFVFKTTIAFIVRKTGPIHLVLVGLTAGRQAGRQADENLAGKHFLKFDSMISNAHLGYLNRFLDVITLH